MTVPEIRDPDSRMSPPATLLIWFQLRSPDLAEEFERVMTDDRDLVRGSLDTVSDWRLTRPTDVPGPSIGQADYVLIAEIVEVERSSSRRAMTSNGWRTTWRILSRTGKCSSCARSSERLGRCCSRACEVAPRARSRRWR